MIAFFLSNISAKYYKNPSMLSRVIAKNVGDVFFWDTVYIGLHAQAHWLSWTLTAVYRPQHSRSLLARLNDATRETLHFVL